MPILKRLHKIAPFAGRLALGVLPLVIAAGLFRLSLSISASAMQADIWFNPCLVLIGLVAHAYFEPWSINSTSSHHETFIERYSFGFVRFRRALIGMRDPEAPAARSARSLLDPSIQVLLFWGILSYALISIFQGSFSSH